MNLMYKRRLHFMIPIVQARFEPPIPNVRKRRYVIDKKNWIYMYDYENAGFERKVYATLNKYLALDSDLELFHSIETADGPSTMWVDSKGHFWGEWPFESAIDLFNPDGTKFVWNVLPHRKGF